MTQVERLPETGLERQVLAAVQPDRLIHLLQDMVRHQSYSNTSGESELSRHMAAVMTKLGMEVELQEVSPGRVQPIGRLRGTGRGASLLFNGHLDTNMVGLGWTRDPFAGEIMDGHIVGIGVSNMKAADAAMMEAVAAIQQSGVKLAGEVLVSLVVGELQGGVGTVHLIESGCKPDYFIVGEPTDLGLLTLHAGSFEASINVLGESRHLSKMEEAVNAVVKASDLIQRLKNFQFRSVDRLDHQGIFRMNIGTIRGGVGREALDWRVPSVPDFCTIRVACRIPPSLSIAEAMEDLDQFIKGVQADDPQFRYELELTSPERKLAMPPFEVDPNSLIVQSMSKIYQRLTGQAPRIGDLAPYKFYGTDAGHLSVRGQIPGLVCGPGGKYNTMPDERVSIADLVTAAQMYALAILEICGPVKPEEA